MKKPANYIEREGRHCIIADKTDDGVRVTIHDHDGNGKYVILNLAGVSILIDKLQEHLLPQMPHLPEIEWTR